MNVSPADRVEAAVEVGALALQFFAETACEGEAEIGTAPADDRGVDRREEDCADRGDEQCAPDRNQVFARPLCRLEDSREPSLHVDLEKGEAQSLFVEPEIIQGVIVPHLEQGRSISRPELSRSTRPGEELWQVVWQIEHSGNP